MSDAVASQDSRKVEVRPVRIIAYAWGEKYVDDFLSLTLPALLAPGNLPAVAKAGPVDVVLLTEKSRFSTFENHRSFRAAREICPIKLVSLDDLIVHASSYGMSLTYTLHRGFADLGPRMTEHCMVFLNADFVLADGSLTSLIGHLHRGERIVASPSYCTNAEDALPQLRKWTDPETGVLARSSREMAALILCHRHNSIRGKTLNQAFFHHRYMDQFYWAVGHDVLLGHQMPIAIVGLRPERFIEEPITYWDYGQIREYCPTSDVCVLGDSDDFLMLELRSRDAVNDYLAFGPYHSRDLGERMIGWVTDYQRDFAQYPLTLHSVDLPADVERARVNLCQAKDEILSYCPAKLHSHVNHPQWEYHKALTRSLRDNKPMLVPATAAPAATAGTGPVSIPLPVPVVDALPAPLGVRVAAGVVRGMLAAFGLLIALKNTVIGAVAGLRSVLVRTLKSIYKAIFGQLPRVTMFNPNWAAWRHVVRLADETSRKGAKRALVVSGQAGPIDELAASIAPGHHRMSLADLARFANGDIWLLEGQGPFDVCVCSLDRAGLVSFSAMVRALAPKLTPDAQVIGFHLTPDPKNCFDDIELIRGTQGFLDAPAVFFAGSEESVEALEYYSQFTTAVVARKLLQAPLKLMESLAKAVIANQAEAACPGGPRSKIPKICTSVTVVVTPAAIADLGAEVAVSGAE